jgi:hypothetical protein
MTSTVLVLVILLMCLLLACIVALAATFQLARRNGQAVKSMSFSPRHGITAVFFRPKNHRAEHQ